MRKSRRMLVGENVGPQVSPRDRRIRDALDDRPPIGVEQDGVFQPITDELLTGLRPTSFPKSCSKRRLFSAGGDVNSAPERRDMPRLDNDVICFHEHPKYTNRFVSATTTFVSGQHKEVCKVLDMSTSKASAAKRAQKAVKPRQERRKALPGPDGKMLGQRVAEAMIWKSGRLGAEYRPADLLRDVNKMGTPDAPILTQQMLSAILRNTVTQTSKTPFIALVCGVSPVWLAQGIGKMTDHA